MTYSGWSDMAKRVPPGKWATPLTPITWLHADLNWARPTGNVRYDRPSFSPLIRHSASIAQFESMMMQVYSTVKDLAKLASLFMVGQGETNNALGMYTSTLREMLTPSYVNDERVRNPFPLPLFPSSCYNWFRFQTTAYGYPFEIYHTSAIGPNVPPYWARVKAGSMPGYFSILMMYPEIKTGRHLTTSVARGEDWQLTGVVGPLCSHDRAVQRGLLQQPLGPRG